MVFDLLVGDTVEDCIPPRRADGELARRSSEGMYPQPELSEVWRWGIRLAPRLGNRPSCLHEKGKRSPCGAVTILEPDAAMLQITAGQQVEIVHWEG